MGLGQIGWNIIQNWEDELVFYDGRQDCSLRTGMHDANFFVRFLADFAVADDVDVLGLIWAADTVAADGACRARSAVIQWQFIGTTELYIRQC